MDKTEHTGNSSSNINLVEVGPRFVLIPIRVFNGSLGGATIYQNSAYVSPNEERSMLKRHKGDRYKERVQHNQQYKQMLEEYKNEPNQLANVILFKENKPKPQIEEESDSDNE